MHGSRGGGQGEARQLSALELRQANTNSVADSFRDAVKRDRRLAPQGMIEEVLTGVWDSARIRDSIRAELADLAGYFKREGHAPPDMSLRVGRIALALYFTETLEAMAQAVAKNKSAILTSQFDVARRAISRILDDSFFTKGSDRIISEYLDAEVAFTACARSCGIALLSLEDASAAYKDKAKPLFQEALDRAFPDEPANKNESGQ